MKKTFFDMYYRDILKECVPMEDVAEVIKKLKSEGHEIHFATARLTNIEGCDTISITKDNLSKFNIPYDKLKVNVADKLKYAKENAIDIFVEDSFETCKSLQENGIKAYLMTTRMNAKIKTNDIERVNNWNELYERIKNYINQE